MKPLALDVHTHSIASGHAYGTITEMGLAAAEAGLKILGITEHTQGVPGACDHFYFTNLKVLPKEFSGTRVLYGAEINILDYDGALSFPEESMHYLDLRIAGIHKYCYCYGDIAENTRAVIGAIKNPHIDIIAHPDDGYCPLDYEAVVQASKDYHVLLEVNNNAIQNPHRLNAAQNAVQLLELCKDHSVPVLLSSDAHYMTHIANTEYIAPLIQKTAFPESLIINYAPEDFLAYIGTNRDKTGQN